MVTTEPENRAFDVAAFLASAGLGRKIVRVKARQTFFSQGNPADSIFYLQKGSAKLSVGMDPSAETTE